VVTVNVWQHLALAAVALAGVFIIAAVIGFAIG
jgi:hypothetical protein